MSEYRSGFSESIERFVRFRSASGSWNEACYGLNIKLFDHFCADGYGSEEPLSQTMVDTWCVKRETETNRSRETRVKVVRTFVAYLRERGATDVLPPASLKPEPRTYVPYAFEEGELRRFFEACDSIKPYFGRRASTIRKLTVPVFFRLLYSTGMRTTEARVLERGDVDLEHGVVSIRKSKGYDQHYVAMHATMAALMASYDRAIDGLQPSRRYFFQSIKGSHYCREWVGSSFRALWEQANGSAPEAPVPYDLRHHYAISNINSWADDGFETVGKLEYLSKSMGHRFVESTRHCCSIVPRLADVLRDRTEAGFNDIVPEVPDGEAL